MNTFSSAFRAEVVRMARKELKPELQGMRKAITGHRSEIAALKREVKSLTSQLKSVRRQTKIMSEVGPSEQTKVSKRAVSEEFAFAPEMLTQMRETMADLLTVTPLSYSRWEKGLAHPRTKQLAKIEELVNMGPAKAEKRMRQAAKG
jgi:hypothetical protein